MASLVTLRLTYYPDITQHRSPAEVRSAVLAFSKVLGEELSHADGSAIKIDVLPVVSVREQTRMIAQGECEIALIKPSSYVFAHGRNPNVAPAAVALRVIDGSPGDTYFAQVYANVASGIRTMDDLRARCHDPSLERRPSIGFGDPFSTANFLVPAAHLLSVSLHPFTRFRKVQFCGGHDGVARAVYRREVDVGAGHDGVIIDLARQAGFADANERLLRLDRVFIHSDPIAVNVDPALRGQITKSLLAIQGRPEITNALDVFWGAVVGLGPTKHENYASVERAIQRLAIPDDDILI